MKQVLDALWRALAYCFMPRVIWLSSLPLLVCASLAGVLGFLYWEPAVAGVKGVLNDWSIVQSMFGWLDVIGLGRLRTLLAPLIVVMLALPVVILSCLLAVTSWLTPALAELVRKRRFPDLAMRSDEPWALGLLRSFGLTALALGVLIVSLPLWLIPPLAALLPPLIWGWLTYRVMTADALSVLASRQERDTLMRDCRWQLLLLGLATGYLGAVPSLLWVLGAASLIFAPILIVVSVWLYTLIFTFSSLWFAHYVLAALADMRRAAVTAVPEAALAGGGAAGLAVPSSVSTSVPNAPST